MPLRPAAWSAAIIEHLEWESFESLCGAFFSVLGIRTEISRPGADDGVSMRLFEDGAAPKRCTAIVHCRVSKMTLDEKAVHALHGVMAAEGVPEGILMAPKRFTHEAHSFAAAHRITLIDGQHLVGLIEHLPPTQQQALLQFVGPGHWRTPVCPLCGKEMQPQVSQRGPRWACTDYPKCSGKLPMGEAPPVGAPPGAIPPANRPGAAQQETR
ncbi:restriction endonuclease [Thauera mechernichensis]